MARLLSLLVSVLVNNVGAVPEADKIRRMQAKETEQTMQSRTASPLIRALGFAALTLALAQMTGCATALSQDTLRQVSSDTPPVAVLEDPKRFVGQVIPVAGTILRLENLKEGTLLEILGYPTTSRGFPDTGEPALGRFLLLYPGYLDALVFQPGRTVATAGRIVGERAMTVGETVRPQPLLHPLELKLLPENPTYYSPVHIGVGFIFGF
jgi:outer membrane lipoprotein